MDPADNSTPPKILIVDQERFSTLISKMLSSKFAPTTAKDGMEAIGYLRSNRPDLLIVEESIPGDGLRFCELMGMSPNFADLPIILLSVSPSPDGILRARAAGVNTYLAKPFRPSELQNRIDSIFASSETLSATDTEAAKDPAAQDPDAKQNIKDRLKKIEGLPPFPATHAQILELANSDNSSSDEIAEQLQMDPSLFTDYYSAVVELSQNEQLWIGEAESQLLGLTHADVGGQLATEWQFAEKYLYSILHHHTPEATGRYQRLTSLGHLADHMCRKLGYGSGGDDQIPELNPAVLERFSLGERGLNILFELAEEELESATSFLVALSSD
ncbi:MAG: HDOD domain-containing protein [Candidatus Latescibacteria bacterium]|nr:HDOD domain-containing protein [Candidatus Latescibacterota bacterium]